MDIRKKVDHAFSNEKDRVMVRSETFCRFVYLKRLPNELDNDEETHQCTESELGTVHK